MIARIVILLLGATAAVGNAAEVTNRNCATWDAAFAGTVDGVLGGVCILTILIGVAVTFGAGRLGWWSTWPYFRLVVSGVVPLVAGAVLLLTPVFAGFGAAPWFMGVDVDYPLCSDRAFEATGFLGGRLGANQLAFVQWPTMMLLLVGTVLLTVSILMVVSKVIQVTRS